MVTILLVPAKGKIVNRVARATDRGFEMEADPRHAELVIEQRGLLMSKGVTTPGVDDREETAEHAYEALDSQVAIVFRDIAARCNFLAADRPGIMHPVKELRREIAHQHRNQC